MAELDVFKIDEANEESQKDFNKIRDREKDDLQAVIKIPGGRRFVLKMLGQTGIFTASFSQNSMTTSFNEGRRDIGLWLLKEIDEVDPMAFSQMQREYYSELKSKKPKQEEK